MNITTPNAVDQLRERMLSGDTTITPADLATARAADEFAATRTEVLAHAEAKKAEESHQAARIKNLKPVRTSLTHLAKNSAEFGELLTAVQQAIDAFANAASARSDTLREARRIMRANDVASIDKTEGISSNDAGLGWRQNLHTGKTETWIDDRVFYDLDAAMFLGHAIDAAVSRNKNTLGDVRFHRSINGDPTEIINRAAGPWTGGKPAERG